jgi:hypothetical protein
MNIYQVMLVLAALTAREANAEDPPTPPSNPAESTVEPSVSEGVRPATAPPTPAQPARTVVRTLKEECPEKVRSRGPGLEDVAERVCKRTSLTWRAGLPKDVYALLGLPDDALPINVREAIVQSFTMAAECFLAMENVVAPLPWWTPEACAPYYRDGAFIQEAFGRFREF